MSSIKGIIRNLSIRKKLILSYLLAFMVPLVSTGLIIYAVSADSLEATSLELASIFNSQVVNNVDNLIDEYDRATKTVLVDSDIINQFGNENSSSITETLNYQLALRRIMIRLVTLKPEITNICFLSSEGHLYNYNTGGSHVDQETLIHQAWFTKLVASDEQIAVSSAHNRSYQDRYQDRYTVSIGRSILDNTGAYVGKFIIDIDPSNLIELSDDFLQTRNQYNVKINVTNFENELLYSSDIAGGKTTWEDASSQVTLLHYEENPEEYIVLTSTTKRSSLNVNVMIPRSDLLAKINNIRYITNWLIALCVLVVILVSVFFSKRITTPLEQLQDRMRQAEEGEYKEMAETASNDEIGWLVKSYNRMVRRIKTLIEDVYIAEIKQKNARYLALKAQINPHMLYNTLESIRMKALVMGADEVADMTKILARMFRLSLHDGPAIHTVKEEIEYAESYIMLQDMRYPGLFFLDIDLCEKIRSTPIISMVLQPIIENCIVHGFKGGGLPLLIGVDGARMDDGDIVIRITDDGKGMSEECIFRINHKLAQTEDSVDGIGMKNIAERIMLYYGADYYLKVANSGPEGTTIEIRIPG